jgi:arylsulfatase A-like enzyme
MQSCSKRRILFFKIKDKSPITGKKNVIWETQKKEMKKLKNQIFVIVCLLLPLFLLFVQCSREKEVKKKQIILLSIDTLRGDHITPYGYRRDTSPKLAELVEDSSYYSNAYTNGCWTHPSHMSLLTGTLPSRHGIDKPLGALKNEKYLTLKKKLNKKYLKLNESLKNIAEVLKPRGFKTIKFAKLPNELGFGNGFDINNTFDPFIKGYKFEWLLKELENHKTEDFFLFIHTWKVHAPYFSNHYLDKGRLSEEVLYYMQNPHKLPNVDGRIGPRYRKFLKENNLLNLSDCVDMYDGGILYVDWFIGEIVNKAKELGVYDELMFIVVSDHGEHFAEHDPRKFYNSHGRDYYEEYVKVPLIFKFPNQAVEPGKHKEPVSLIDVFPTVLDFYDIEIPGFAQGASLLKPRSQRKQYIVSEAVSQPHEERKMILKDNLKYIVTMQNPSRREGANWDSIKERRLFNLEEDPREKKNLYNDQKYRNDCVDLENMLKEIIEESSSTNQTTVEITLDPETLEQMKALGYL